MGNPRKNTQKGSPLLSRKSNENGSLTALEPVRHVLFPAIPYFGCLHFHVTKFAFCVLATGLQLLNLFRTVWWLPRIKTDYPIDIERIDFYLVAAILLMFVAPPAYEAFQRLYWRTTSPTRWFVYSFLGLSGLLSWCIVQIHVLKHINYENCNLPHKYLGVLVLVCQPVLFAVVYTYGPVKRLLTVSTEKLASNLAGAKPWSAVSSLQTWTSSLGKSLKQLPKLRKTIQLLARQYLTPGTPRGKSTAHSTRVPRYSSFFPTRYATVHQSARSLPAALRHHCLFYTARPPSRQMVLLKHNCSRCSPFAQNSSPGSPKASSADGGGGKGASQAVREEAEVLWADFKARLVDTVVGTTVSTFYATVVPCLFIQSGESFNYDVVWCVAHALLCGSTLFLLHWQYLLPPSYLDLLHRCAAHLGGWEVCTKRSGYVNWQAWSQLQTYPRGARVKHVRGLYQAVGGSNAADPGNSCHSRLFFWFYSPTFVTDVLCCVAVAIALCQLCCLEWVHEWYKLLGLAAVSPFTLLNLYSLLRNRFVISWVCGAKNPIYECCNPSCSTPARHVLSPACASAVKGAIKA
uniref:Conserved plasma membrane protein n=2 Tax=Mesocestoides corti TaxID=53468 RepID=A0A5K3F0M5_MESCO